MRFSPWLGLGRLILFVVLSLPASAANVTPAINALGLDLYREQIKSADGKGVLLSPYSISAALAMVYAGADGDTRKEMQQVLRFPGKSDACSQGFHEIAVQLRGLEERWARIQEEAKKWHEEDSTHFTLQTANRLFVQQDFKLEAGFLGELATGFDVVPGAVDFKNDAPGTRNLINRWVADFTHDRIRDLLPAGLPSADTRLALVNALYLKASWLKSFTEERTAPQPFHLSGSRQEPVPTMVDQRHFAYDKRTGYTVVAIPYQTGGLQFTLLVPDAIDGLATIEQKLAAGDLASFVHLDSRDVVLYLPKFKLEPETMPLGNALQALGLLTAFDRPRGSANFNRMSPRRPDDYLAIGEVFHKTWLSLDEYGTEAAAATAILGYGASMPLKPPPPPVIVRADRPFLFAIQHMESGACLFLGRVTDPR